MGDKRKVSTWLPTECQVNEHPGSTMVTEEHSESGNLVNPETDSCQSGPQYGKG